VEKDMQYPVDVVCYRCAIVLPVLDTPVGRAAWCRFTEEHAYHPVEILWEHSEAWERIDIDFIQVDSDISSDPSLAEYAGDDWAGRPLALQARPAARAVAEIVTRAEDAFAAGEWQVAAGDAAVAEQIAKAMDFAPPPGVLVDETTVRARSAAVLAALERLHLATAEPFGENFRAVLEELLRTLPSPSDVPAAALVAESGPLASPPSVGRRAGAATGSAPAQPGLLPVAESRNAEGAAPVRAAPSALLSGSGNRLVQRRDLVAAHEGQTR
jgi:hypothetical protein